MTIQAIYWDIGGVLIRTLDRRPRQELAERFGLTYQALEELVFGSENGRRAQRGELLEAERWVCLADELGVSPDEIPAVRRAFFGGDSLDEHLIAYIRRLHPRYRTGIISNGMSGARKLIEETYGLARVFDHFTISAEVGFMKPDARIYQHALAGLNVEPAASVFIDDFLRNVEGARAAGMHATHFRNPDQTLAELDALLAG